MKINKKIKINKEELDINLKFYLFLKEINGTGGLTEKELQEVFKIILEYTPKEYKKAKALLQKNFEEIKKEERRENMLSLILQIEKQIDYLVFSFAVKLLIIKPLLLQEAKITNIEKIKENLKYNRLSLKYDQISKNKPYYTRVNGALLSLLFFEKLNKKETSFLSQDAEDYINSLAREYEIVKREGVKPNQIFMLMFSESVNQSITSDAGSSYENRIYQILIDMGIDEQEIEKTHDEEDSSTEFDFYFTLKGKKFGIGAKRTLRERYKQFIKTAHMSKDLDIMIEITLGLDLREKIAESIRKHGVFLFVADEIYNSRKFLQEIDGIFPASKLSVKLLVKLAENDRQNI